MLLITSESGSIILCKKNKKKVVFQTDKKNEGFFGIKLFKDFIYATSNRGIYKFANKLADEKLICLKKNENIFDRKFVISFNLYPKDYPAFHNLIFFENKIYVTATRFNEIWIFDLNLNLLRKIKIQKPISILPLKVFNFKNYNHINSIHKYKNNFYLSLCWFNSKYGYSGVMKTDLNFNPIQKFRYGWESHDFQYYRTKKLSICGSTKYSKKLNHPIRSGLYYDNKIVFEYDSDKYFCKGILMIEDQIILFGGSQSLRKLRHKSDGVIFKLDNKNFNLREKIVLNETGGFCNGIEYVY